MYLFEPQIQSYRYGSRLSSISQTPFCCITEKKKVTPVAASPISRAEGDSSQRELSAAPPVSTTALHASAAWKRSDGGLVTENLLFQLKLHL